MSETLDGERGGADMGPSDMGPDSLLGLHTEVSEFASYTEVVRQAQHPEVSQVLACVTAIVAFVWPQAQVHLYGSRSYGLSLADSDIDIVVTNLDGDPSTHTRRLSEALSNESWVLRSFPLDRAAVPVIKLQTILTPLSADISFGVGSEARGGIMVHSGMAMGGMMCGLKNNLPAMGPLVCVLKQYLKERGLNTPYTGGLSSICLACMVASYLKDVEATDDSPSGNSNNLHSNPNSLEFSETTCAKEAHLGELLTGFLDHFGQLDYTKASVSVHHGTSSERPSDTDGLFIEDPLQPGSDANIAKGVFAMPSVKAAFWHASRALQGEYCGGDACGCNASVPNAHCSIDQGCTDTGSQVFAPTLGRVLLSRHWEQSQIYSQMHHTHQMQPSPGLDLEMHHLPPFNGIRVSVPWEPQAGQRCNVE